MIPSMHHETKVREKLLKKTAIFGKKKKLLPSIQSHPCLITTTPKVYTTTPLPSPNSAPHHKHNMPQKTCLIQLGFPDQASVIVVDAQLFGLTFFGPKKRMGTSMGFWVFFLFV